MVGPISMYAGPRPTVRQNARSSTDTWSALAASLGVSVAGMRVLLVCCWLPLLFGTCRNTCVNQVRSSPEKTAVEYRKLAEDMPRKRFGGLERFWFRSTVLPPKKGRSWALRLHSRAKCAHPATTERAIQLGALTGSNRLRGALRFCHTDTSRVVRCRCTRQPRNPGRKTAGA